MKSEKVLYDKGRVEDVIDRGRCAESIITSRSSDGQLLFQPTLAPSRTREGYILGIGVQSQLHRSL